MAMSRIHVSCTPEQRAALGRLAAERGIPISALVREAIDREVVRHEQVEACRRREASDDLVRASGQTAAQALLEWAKAFGQPGMAESIDGHGARDHDQILADMDEW
jgi:hypothetical protein